MRERIRQQKSSGFLSFSPSLFLSIFLFFFLSACSVPLYKIAPLPQNSTIPDGKSAAINELEITASALLDDDKSFELFEANLPLAGIVAVNVHLKNNAATSARLKFSLHDMDGKKFSWLSADKELKRVMDFEGVRAYPKDGKQATLDQLKAIALPEKFELAAQAEKRGVLFFHVKQDATKLRGLRLKVERGTEPLTISLQ